jgi:CRP/FNR family cyclic AMP-dependent transcriptional regulator
MSHFPTPRDRRFAPGQVILCEEDEASAMYIIKRGKVRVLKRSRRGDVLLGDLGPGNLIGEMSLIDHRRRSATAIALEDTSCIELPYQLIEESVDRSAPWVVAILRILVLRLRAADTALADNRTAMDSGDIPIDAVTERHMRKIVRQLEETSALEWERLAAGRPPMGRQAAGRRAEQAVSAAPPPANRPRP